MPVYESPQPASQFFICDCCHQRAEPSFTQRVWTKVFEPDDIDRGLFDRKTTPSDYARLGWTYSLDFGHKECLDARR